VDLYIRSPIHLNGVVLNSLGTGTTLPLYCAYANFINSIHKCALPEKCQINVKDQVVTVLNEVPRGGIDECTAHRCSPLDRRLGGPQGPRRDCTSPG
jgi:hypothetical protein